MLKLGHRAEVEANPHFGDLLEGTDPCCVHEDSEDVLPLVGPRLRGTVAGLSAEDLVEALKSARRSSPR